jgi:RNA polymerase sigma factor (sigma-70 family)
MSSAVGHPLGAAFTAHERHLWGLCYRMTGCAADADDLVQETFARALAQPPADTSRPWRPWLVRVGMNLATDMLRRRRRRQYVGQWLPSPIATDDEAPPAHEPVVTTADGRPVTTESRYDLLESVSFAFLLALETLSPKQRAVLLLREVFDYTVRETADALGMSEPNAKVTHLRARRAMAAYDRERCPPTPPQRDQTRDMLQRFLIALRGEDVAAVEALLADDVRAISDGGGAFHAARSPVIGRAKVARFAWNIARQHAALTDTRVIASNGLPAVVFSLRDPRPDQPPRVLLTCELGGDGRIRRVYNVLAIRKLTAIASDA